MPTTGYIIPNANDAFDYKQAEPDALDFQLLGNAAYGVLHGCDHTINSGNSFEITSSNNVVLNNNSIEQFGGPISVGLNGGAGDDRFDLVVWNGTELELLTGTATSDPEFPAVADDLVLIAALFVPAGLAPEGYTTDHITDKRVALTRGARGASEDTDVFLNTVNPDGTPKFKVLGDGTSVWGDDSGPTLGADSATTLEVTGDSITLPDVNTGDVSVGGTLDATGRLTAKNWDRGTTAEMNALTGTDGDTFQNTTLGRLHIWKDGQWREIYEDEYPVGTIITSLLFTQPDASWLVLDGSTYNKSEVRTEFIDLVVTPHDLFTQDATTFTVPNLRGYFLQNASASDQMGNVGGDNSFQLQTSHLPSHDHFGGATETGLAGGHSHDASASSGGSHSHTSGGGSHSHPVTDPQHTHDGLDQYGNGTPTYFCGAAWGGLNKLDALFSDASHTWTVDMAVRTIPASTGISIPHSGSHSHTIHSGGSHSHSVVMDSAPSHTHSLPNETATGGDQAFDNRPLYIQVNYFVKA